MKQEEIIEVDGKLFKEFTLRLANADKHEISVGHTFANDDTCLKYRENQLLYFKTDDRLALNKNECLPIDCDADEIFPQFVYILSDENVKNGDYSLYEYSKLILIDRIDMDGDHKVVASNDLTISSKIPLLPFNFIEYLVSEYSKGNKFTKVLIEVSKVWIAGTSVYGNGDYDYCIKLDDNHIVDLIIPKPEIPKHTVHSTKIEYVCKNCGERYPYKPVFCNNCGMAFDFMTFDFTIDGIKQNFTNNEIKDVVITSNNNNFLAFIYHILIDVHKENPNSDYMLKLKEISNWVDKNIKF